MPSYKGKELTKYKEKTGGKNRNAVDGFYNTSDGEEFFIKNPMIFVNSLPNYLQGSYWKNSKAAALYPKYINNPSFAPILYNLKMAVTA